MTELIRSDTFFGGETRGEETRKGCDLPHGVPFILSLNLIGVAQLAPYIAHRIVSGDNRDFPRCRFIMGSTRIHNFFFFFAPANQYHISGWIPQNGSRRAASRLGSGACDAAADLLTLSSRFDLM